MHLENFLFDVDGEGVATLTINRPKKLIVADYYIGYGNDSKLQCRIVGTTAESIAGTATKRKLVTVPYHGAYLGKELAKAEIALKHDLPYEQESELDLNKLKEKKD